MFCSKTELTDVAGRKKSNSELFRCIQHSFNIFSEAIFL